ncbi:MAG: hypothetical protein ABIQ52_06735 [Vicinamibacterales bacterium]
MLKNENTEPSCEEQLAVTEEQLGMTRRENEKLQEENRHLLSASDAFGQLAERLNTELQLERRLGDVDRRRSLRAASMSRRTSPSTL